MSCEAQAVFLSFGSFSFFAYAISKKENEQIKIKFKNTTNLHNTYYRYPKLKNYFNASIVFLLATIDVTDSPLNT